MTGCCIEVVLTIIVPLVIFVSDVDEVVFEAEAPAIAPTGPSITPPSSAEPTRPDFLEVVVVTES